jgi:cell division cycle 20-like protein 1 (cofactor of APC complex)
MTEVISVAIVLHGYTQNHISIWGFLSLRYIVKPVGHSFRLLYIAMSPRGETVLSGVGDETLCFWIVCSTAPKKRQTHVS